MSRRVAPRRVPLERVRARTYPFTRFVNVDEVCPDADKHRVMHAPLRVGDAQRFLSDGPSDRPHSEGGNIHVVLDCDNVVDMQRAFDTLAASGAVTNPIEDQFWGAKFGTLTDEFGIQWMFTCATTPE